MAPNFSKSFTVLHVQLLCFEPEFNESMIRYVDTGGSIVPMLSIVRKTAYFYRGLTFCGARLAGTLGDVAEGFDLNAKANLMALPNMLPE